MICFILKAIDSSKSYADSSLLGAYWKLSFCNVGLSYKLAEKEDKSAKKEKHKKRQKRRSKDNVFPAFSATENSSK